MAQIESSCMKGITLVHIGKRNFRVPTASLPASFSSKKDVYVRTHNKDDNNKAESANEEEITLKLDISRRFYGLIIGRGGYNIKQLREETKAKIFVNYDGPVVIIGTKDRVEIAKKRIEDTIAQQNNNNTENEKSINDTKIEDKKKDDDESIKESIKDNEDFTFKLYVPTHLHGPIIGKGGSVVQQIMAETNTKIIVQRYEKLAIISGAKDGVEMARKRIENIIESQYKTANEKSDETKIEDKNKDDGESIKESIKDNEEITHKFNILGRFHGAIIGKGGNTVKQIMTETNTRITIQRYENLATIRGTKDGVGMAIKRIEDIIESYNNAGNANNSTEIGDNKKENIESIRESVINKKEVHEGYFTDRLDVPQPLHRLIIGRGGGTVKQIMAETKTNIIIPKDENLVSNLVTISGTKVGIERAKKQIKNIIESDSIFILPPTHFISIPLTDTHLQRKVEDFKSNVLELNLQGVDKSILINSHTLHITIGTLHLYRKEDIEGAMRLLKSLSKTIDGIIGTRTLVSTLSGLAVMENDIVKSHVLYAKVEEPEGQNSTLKKLGEYLIEEFAAEGYLKKENRPLKLHVTLINTRHRNEHSASSNNDKHGESNRYPFNAGPILNKFGGIEFGNNRLESIHISKIGEYDENGRHRSEGGIKLP
ncbi:unnamed protein product [Rhizophagus irregularis]|nr:unnamed protein product [Rhizophagus irregularis]CAB5348266.1 unnamed protein product [Rhizophagus irregularis]